MSFTTYETNANNFSEVTESDKQPLVTNNLGRDADELELVYLDGYFGEIKEAGGIADTETGRININSDRTIRTEQVEATDTFTVGAELWFHAGGSGAAGKLVDADPGSGTRVSVGIITEEEGTGGAQTSVTFRPYVQVQASITAIATLQAEPRLLVVEVASDYGTAAVAVAGLAEGDKIIGVKSNCNVMNTAGTIQLLDGAAAAITDAMQQAADKEVAYAATIDKTYSTLPASGATLLAGGTDETLTRCTVVIEYIPA